MADAKDLPHHERPVFAATSAPDGSIILTVGVPENAWKHMQGGKTLNVDLRRGGVPVTLILFGGATQATCKATIEEWNRTAGRPGLDMTDQKDAFSLKQGGQSRAEMLGSVFKR